MKLRVIQPFGDHNVGELITDEAEIQQVLACPQAAYVVKVPDEPAPTAKPAAKK